MERRIQRQSSTHADLAIDRTAGPMSYRAEICRRDAEGKTSSYYDGGQFSPYCIESLIELLRGEARIPHQSLDVMLELHGDCTSVNLRDVAARFGAVSAPRVLVRICSPGRAPVIIGSGSEDEQTAKPDHREPA